MNELPTEIFNRIMVLLPLEDKVEFMAVCKKWAHIIKTYCLLETIHISSHQQLNRIVEKLKKNPPEAKQVERLILDLRIDSHFDFVHFFNQFANLRTIFINRPYSTQFQAMTIPSQNNRIESIFDTFGNIIASYFLTSNKCTLLKRLDINSGGSGSIPGNVINPFPRLPMLNTLFLGPINISFKELETLHSLMPLLRSFKLSYFRITNAELPSLIEPATSVTAINLSIWNLGLPMCTRFFQYARQKYPKIKDLSLSMSLRRGNLEERYQFYNDGLIPLVQSAAPQLERYQLNLGVMPEYFLDALNQIEGNIEYAHIYLKYDDIGPGLEKCIQTNQAKYITELSLITESDFNFTLLKEFSALKKLDIDIKMDDIEVTYILNDLLKACCSTVEYIRLMNGILKYDPMDTQEYKNIRKIKLFKVDLDSGIDIFISKYLPNVRDLCFHSCIFPETKFYLSNINLSSLTIKSPRYWIRNELVYKLYLNLLVCTRNDEQGRLWISNGSREYFGKKNDYLEFSDHSAYPQVKSVPFDDTSIYPFLIFHLASVRNIFIR